MGKNTKRKKIWRHSIRNAESKLCYLLDLVSLSLLLSDYIIKIRKNILNFWANLSKHTFHKFFVETESTAVFARAWGEGVVGRNC